MIQCPKCETNNPSGRDICEECGAKLLPGEGIGDRLGNLIVGGKEFKCEILEDYPDRLYCHGTGVKAGTQVDASWYLKGGELPVYETEITIP